MSSAQNPGVYCVSGAGCQERRGDDDEECPELKTFHAKRHDVLTDERDPHTFSVLIQTAWLTCTPQLPTALFPRRSWRRTAGLGRG